jgi:hypothetical protein
MRFAVIQLARNCEQYYLNDFPILWRHLQSALQNQANFFCVENDSSDATVRTAQRFGHVLSLPTTSTGFLTQRCTARTTWMADLRNRALQWVLDFGPFDYYIWLDTNVFFTASTITRLWSTVQNDETIGLAGANTLQAGHAAHYYDTYALNTPNCLWQECRTCQGPHCIRDTAEVPSAFGGLCFMRPVLCTFAADYNLCEHVYMCAQLRERGYRIVVVGLARATWVP